MQLPVFTGLDWTPSPFQFLLKFCVPSFPPSISFPQIAFPSLLITISFILTGSNLVLWATGAILLGDVVVTVFLSRRAQSHLELCSKHTRYCAICMITAFVIVTNDIIIFIAFSSLHDFSSIFFHYSCECLLDELTVHRFSTKIDSDICWHTNENHVDIMSMFFHRKLTPFIAVNRFSCIWFSYSFRFNVYSNILHILIWLILFVKNKFYTNVTTIFDWKNYYFFTF